jgi:hypothetical protein
VGSDVGRRALGGGGVGRLAEKLDEDDSAQRCRHRTAGWRNAKVSSRVRGRRSVRYEGEADGSQPRRRQSRADEERGGMAAPASRAWHGNKVNFGLGEKGKWRGENGRCCRVLKR